MAERKFASRYILPYFKKFMCRRQQDIIVVFLFFSLSIMFAMRSSLPIALLEINSHHINVQSEYPKTYCPGIYKPVSNGSDVDWTELQLGLILSSYYIGYSIGQIPGALATMKFGAKNMIIFCILGSSLTQLFLPTVINYNKYSLILLMQFVIGLIQGTKFPAVADMLVGWIPDAEFRFSVRFVCSGVMFGTLFGFLGSGILISLTKDWRVMFYFTAAAGFIYTILFIILCYNGPHKHPIITETEKIFLTNNLSVSSDELSAGRITQIPWRRILKSTSIISLIPAQFGHAYVASAFITYLPKYAADVLHLNLFQITVYTTVVLVTSILVIVVTHLSFRYIRCSGDWNENFRKIIFIIASFIPSIFFVVGTFSECNKIQAMACFAIGIASSVFCYPELRGNVFEINKIYACCILAAMNCFTGLVGAVTFLFIGLIVETRSTTEWKLISLASFMVLSTSSTLYVLWSSAKPDSFQNEDKTENTALQHSLENEDEL